MIAPNNPPPYVTLRHIAPNNSPPYVTLKMADAPQHYTEIKKETRFSLLNSLKIPLNLSSAEKWKLMKKTIRLSGISLGKIIQSKLNIIDKDVKALTKKIYMINFKNEKYPSMQGYYKYFTHFHYPFSLHLGT